MKIGVMSDTHDRLESLSKVIEIFKENDVGQIIHCGDWVSPLTLEYFDSISRNLNVPIKSVYGNNEGDIKNIIRRNNKLRNPVSFTFKDTIELNIQGRKVVVYHGDDKVILNALIKSGIYDAIFTGHTHAVRNEVAGKTLVLNPGATCFIAESKIIDKGSVAIYNSDTNSAEIIYFNKD
jgi:putative phosphoesterase